MQPRPKSRIADSFGSRLGGIVRHLSREHLTFGIILLVLGVFAFQISPWLAWFTVGVGVLLLTWHTRMQGTYRALLYFIALLPVLHWFNSVNEFLFHEDAVSGMVLSRDTASPLELVYGLIFAIVAVGAGAGWVAWVCGFGASLRSDSFSNGKTTTKRSITIAIE